MELSGQLHPPGERAPGTHYVGGWVGLRAGLDAVEERNNYCPYGESNPDLQPRSLSLYRQSYPGSCGGIYLNGRKASQGNNLQETNNKYPSTFFRNISEILQDWTVSRPGK
jgi:hypothetical protein